MKRKIIAVVTTSLVMAPFAFAISIQADLGPSGIVTGAAAPRIATFSAPDVAFQGQNIAVDFTFQNSQFIRLFTETFTQGPFSLDIFLRINNAPSPQVFTGTGYVADAHGGALSPSATVQAFPTTNGSNQVVGTDFFFTPSISNSPPVDVYDIHLDLTLPNSPGFGFGNGASGAITLGAQTLGIGPNIPSDVIPETGGAIGLFGLGLTALVAVQWLFRCRLR